MVLAVVLLWCCFVFVFSSVFGAPGEKTTLDCHKFVRVTSAVFADNVM